MLGDYKQILNSEKFLFIFLCLVYYFIFVFLRTERPQL